ncbi:hypothetical protein [Actinoplanes sp. N902-109]|uniref:hypothetical protein n=1 Tax=Actinoplanes sp. (strain N902-109) TaxID=649831 RepID=UPI0003296480|nr:hypothetical protein [Actinoplanes sp. N902-109]AGL20407.1 hypothetical protein L083_6897 [Actinoplanes sp. N902-109]
MMVTPEIRAVLDTSAIESYAVGHVHVGELIADLTDGRICAGLPAAALAEAYSRHTDDLARARIDLLTKLDGTMVLALDAASAPQVGMVFPLTGGDMAQAQAVAIAREHSAIYLTVEPKRSAHLVDPDAIVSIPAKDA